MTPGQPNTFHRASAPTPRGFARRCLGWLLVWLMSVTLGLGPALADGQADVSDKVGLSFSGLGLNRYTNTFDTTATLTNLSGVAVSAPMALVVTGISQASVTLANAAGLTADGHPYVNVPLATGRLEPGARVTGVTLKYNNPNRVKFLATHAVYGVPPNTNHPPTASAGPDQPTFVGRTVTLDGSGSSDLDGDPLTYRWSLTGLPAGSAALLAGATGLNPSFTVDRPGSYTAQLIVNDGQADSAPDSVAVSTRNSPPVARAGADQTAPVGQALTLDGSASGDADGDPLAFLWSLTQRPAGSGAALSQPDTQAPGLTLDKPGHYEARLVVNDGRLDSDPDLVAIDTRNSPPVADAGPDSTGRVGDAFALNGAASGDVDGDGLTYRWSLLSQPAGSQATLADPAVAAGSLTPDLAGDYVAQLIVNDGQADSAPDTARITAQANRLPLISSTPPATATAGQPYAYAVAAGDPDGDALAFALTVSPAGMVIDPLSGLIQWTPGDTDTGTRPVTVRVVDGHGGQATQSFDLTVGAPPNRAPSLTSTPAAAAAVGQPYAYAVAASDPDGDPLAFALTRAPAGMTVNPASGLIQWTPGAGQTGAHPVTVRVEDGHGGQATQDYALTVSAAPQATVPALTGLTRPAAEAALRQARLAVGVLAFRHDAASAEGLVLVQNLAAGTHTGLGTAVDLTVSLGPDTGLPPDPQTIAPATDPTVATTVADSTQFLYGGPNPIQTLADGRPLAEGAIETLRAAVLRGRVLDRAGQPLPGVTVGIKDHPELGRTLTRADGAYDLAVNGGGTLTLDFQKAGHLPVQRQADAPWQDYVPLDDAVMIPLDGQSAAIQLGGASPAMQVAQGGPVTDADGARQATVLFPAGTRATFARPDGSTGALATLHVRATEYTVGDSGPRAMPGPLPANSGYTYAVELSVDEALAEGAGRVDFDRPLPFYVDNFIGFAVGQAVPAGWYDRAQAAWVASDNGRVVKLLGVASGLADLDGDGDGLADDAAQLAALGVTAEERGQLALLYPVGKTLWRVPVTHFTPWDLNWPQGTPQTLASPRPAYPPRLAAPRRDLKQDCANEASGSIIECENAVLGERLAIAGTPYTLNYRSDRAPGRTAGATLSIPLAGAGLPTGVLGIDLRIQIAGRTLEQSFPAAPGQSQDFAWDGLDAYGRQAYGTQFATVSVGYRYGGAYYPADGAPLAFGRPSASPALSPAARAPFTLWQTWRSPLEAYPASAAQGLGGWTLDAQHHYDPVGQQLSFGGGGQRGMGDRRGAGDWAETAAGTGAAGSGGDGGPAGAAQLNNPGAVVVAPDGTAYVAETGGHRVRRIGPDGAIATVAGTGAAGSGGGDGGPASATPLNTPSALALGPDGSLYVADRGNHRILRISPGGLATRVAGTGLSTGAVGDNGPATAARVPLPNGVAVGPDGSLYFSEALTAGSGSTHRVRRVGPDGIVTTVAGSGSAGGTGDGKPATTARLNFPRQLALGPDGSLYIADSANHRIRRVGPDGTMTTAAGTGTAGSNGDGGPASAAQLNTPFGVAVGPDGGLYIGDTNNHRVHRVAPDGTLATAMGTGTAGYGGDGGPAAAAGVNAPRGVAVGPDGDLRVADSNNFRLRRIKPRLPALGVTDQRIPSADGSELYEFSPAGRHERTLDALTGAVRQQFVHDAAGRLAVVADGDGDTTAIERDALGNPTAIVAPDGQRTALAVDGNGRLARVADPAGQAHAMAYTADGLLTEFRNPNGHASTFDYDGLGRLRTDRDANGDPLTLTRSLLGDAGHEVALATAEGRTTLHRVEPQANGDHRRTLVDPAGLATVRIERPDGTATATGPDGTVLTTVEAGDPRFGWRAPFVRSATLATGGLTRTLTATRAAALADPADPLSLTGLTETATVNGRTSTRAYDAAARLLTATSAAGRTATASLDALGRPLAAAVAGLLPAQWTYDPRGRLIQASQGDRSTAYGYDAQGYLQSVTDPLGRQATYVRDAAGRITVATLPGGRAVQYGYDANGNLTSLTPPGQPAHLFRYAPTDRPAQYEPPAATPGGVTVHAYNRDKQPTRITRPDGQAIEFAYDAAGRLETLTTPEGATAHAYGATGHLASVTAPDTGGLAFTYSGALLTGAQWSGTVQGAVGYAYDADFRVREVTLNGAGPVAFGYDADGLLTSAGALGLSRDAQNGLLAGTTLGVVGDSLSYNGFGEVAAYTATVGGGPVFAAAYGRDRLGRITQATETVQGVAAVRDYGYDAAGRLAEVRVNGLVTAAYGYDANGNRTTLNGQTVAHYDAQDRLLDYHGATYAHTANGELLSKARAGQTTQYRYDVLGSLRHVDLPGGTALDYVIDGANRRIGKKVNGALVQGFLYQDGRRVAAELDGSNQVVSRFVYADKSNVPAYLVKGGDTYRIISDHLGSPRLVINAADGTVAQRMDYDEWGRVIYDSNPGFQPFGYAGGLYDRDTGLVRFGARDYDPETGRWTAKDPIGFAGGDANLFGYVGNDPISRIDPDGRFWWWAVGAGLTLWDMFKPIEPNPDYPDAIESVDTLPGPLGLGKTAKKSGEAVEGICRRFDIDPRDLLRPPSQPEADPFKLADQVRKYGNSTKDMPPVLVRKLPNGEYQILDGVTRAQRSEILRPGQTIPVELVRD